MLPMQTGQTPSIPIDNTIQSMNEVQAQIVQLQKKGWTLADELGVTVNAVEKWKAGDRQPANSKAILAMLEQIGKRKRIPKKRRYAKDNKI